MTDTFGYDPFMIRKKLLIAVVFLFSIMAMFFVSARAADDANALIAQGQKLVEQKRLSEAITTFRQAVRAQPDSVAARRALADVLFDTGNLNEATAQYAE